MRTIFAAVFVLAVLLSDASAQVQLQNPELALSVIATDSTRAKEFYQDCLGLIPTGRLGAAGVTMFLYNAGQATVKVRVYTTDPPYRDPALLASNGIRFITIPVPRFDTVVARLKARGFAAPALRSAGGVRTALALDGDGNTVELLDAATAPTRKLEIGLIVADTDSAKAFYERIMGFPAAAPVDGPPPVDGATEFRYRANNTVLRFFAPSGSRPTPREGVSTGLGYRYITFTVRADVDLLYQRMVDSGFSVAAPLAPYGPVYFFMIHGPGGAIHEFVGPKHVETHDAFTDLVFTADYYAPGLPPQEDFSKTTEANALVVHTGKLYCATTYVAANGDPSTSDPKILVKDSPTGAWRIDYKGGNKFVRFPIIRSVSFTSDGNGNPLTPPVPVLVAGTGAWRAWNPDGVYVISKDDNAQQWVEHKLSDNCWNPIKANHGCEVRTIFDHRDRVTGVHYVFAGAYNGALYRGWYNAAKPGLIEWDPQPEIDSLLGHVLCAAEVGDTLYAGMSFGEGSGIPFVTRPFKDYGLWKRIDGVRKPVVGHDYDPADRLQWEWIPIPAWQKPDSPAVNLRMGQFRGLTAIPKQGETTPRLLAFHWDSPDCLIETVDPANGYASSVELNTRDFVRTAWNNNTAGMVTAGYNDWLPATHPVTKEAVHLIGTWAMYPGGELGSPEGKSSWLLVRYGDATYKIVRIWDPANPLTGAENGLKGCRSISLSPFPQDSGRVWYFCGFDLTGQGTASIGGSKAWIYKGRIGGQTTSIEPVLPSTPELSVFPNPSRDFVTIIGANGLIRIHDLLGREVWSGPISGMATVNLASLPRGMYLVRSGTGTTRFLHAP